MGETFDRMPDGRSHFGVWRRVERFSPMLAATLVSLGVVFLAELGDKSQLMTMTYALRHRWWVVLSGVGIASFLVHGLSVAIGHFLGLSLPERPIAFAAAIVFLLFALWTWREGRGDGDDDAPAVAEPRFVLFAIISSFVLAELGDKTMLATVALASDHNWARRLDRRHRGHGARRRGRDRRRRRVAQAVARGPPAPTGGRHVPVLRPLVAHRRRAGVAVASRRHHGPCVAVAALTAGVVGVARGRRVEAAPRVCLWNRRRSGADRRWQSRLER